MSDYQINNNLYEILVELRAIRKLLERELSQPRKVTVIPNTNRAFIP